MSNWYVSYTVMTVSEALGK